jgi:hypothetical protein
MRPRPQIGAPRLLPDDLCRELHPAMLTHNTVALPTHQAGQSQKTEQPPLIKAVIVAIGRRALIDAGLGGSRYYNRCQ